MDYSRVEEYLDTFVNYEVIPGFGFAEDGYDLGHVRELLRRLGNPQFGPRTVHVAGSKGKGSISAMAASALTACGLTTGLYISPHLVHLGERIQVNGECATPGELLAAIDAVWSHLEAMRVEGRWRRFTYFEVLTVLAFLHFRTKNVQAQVLEVGLGGRLDATNVVTPDVCVITPISLEHTAVLGDTLGKIASEKAGIIKPGAHVVSAPQPPEAMGVIESVCTACGVPLVRVGKDVTWTLLERSLDGQTIQSRGAQGVRVIHIPLAAPYEAENAVASIAALEALQSRGVALDAECVSLGFSRTQWPGRFQVLARDPLLVLDGAHNPASMRRLAESVGLFRRSADIVYVLGFSSDKDVRGAVRELLHTGGRFVLTRSGQPRALEPVDVAVRISDLGVQVACERQPRAALWLARSMVGTEGTVVVAGSLYLVGDVLRGWQEGTESQARWGRPPGAMARVSGG